MLGSHSQVLTHPEPHLITPLAHLGYFDRFDTLAGIFAIGKAPTGSADPFGLRRRAAGSSPPPGRSRSPNSPRVRAHGT